MCHSNIHHRTNATRGAIPWQTCPPKLKYSEDVCLVIVKIDLLARCIFGGGNGEFSLPSDGGGCFSFGLVSGEEVVFRASSIQDLRGT